MISRYVPGGRVVTRPLLWKNALGCLAALALAGAGAPAVGAAEDLPDGRQLQATGNVPVITLQPRSQALVVDLSATLEVVAAAEDTLFYQWNKDGTDLVNTTNVGGVTSAVLSFAPFTAQDAGVYRVRVRNAAGTVTSEPATLLALPNPSITMPPLNQVVIAGSAVVVGVTASGTAPLAYYWYKDGLPVAGATGPSLSFDPVTAAQAGTYQVVVSNSVGTATSLPASLVVKPNTPRRLRVTDLERLSPTQALVPIELAAQGDEQQLAFSLHFNPAVLRAPLVILTPEAGQLLPGASVAVHDQESATGRLGVTVTLPPGQLMPAQTFRLVEVAFGLISPVWAQARLAFADAPVPLEARGLAGAALPVLDDVSPVLQVGPLAGTPSGQSGLFEHAVSVVNISADSYPGIEVLARGLTADSLGIPLRLANASGSTNGIPLVYYGPLLAGSEVSLALAYYVADRRTLPTPAYEARVVPAREPATPSGLVFSITQVRFVEGRTLIEFQTLAGRRYLIQYAENLGAPLWRTALPEVLGTGYRVQWIDDGPPKTASSPTSQVSRFYRGLLLP